MMAQPVTSIQVSPFAATWSKPNVALTLFFLFSLTLAMSVRQDVNHEIGSFIYWLFVLPIFLLPLCNHISIMHNLVNRAWPLLAFGLIGSIWHVLSGDNRTAMQLSIMVWGLAWLGCDQARLADRDLVRLYIVLILIGACVWLLTDLNKWGLLPFTTLPEYADNGRGWRLSFYPNIANSAMLSLGMLLVLTRNRDVMRRYWPVLLLTAYFAVFSFVRTVLIGLALYLFMRWWLQRKPRSSRAMFWMALLLGVGINLIVATSTPILTMLQDIGLISRLFLRSHVELSEQAIYVQLYRPWLWKQHLELFWHSPCLMGLGVFDLSKMQLYELNVGTTPAGNEALITRLLATYGLPTLLYVYYILRCLYDLTRRGDVWACSCFPTIILLMMQWGNIFHPTDADGALLMLILLHGTRAFLAPRSASEFTGRSVARA